MAFQGKSASSARSWTHQLALNYAYFYQSSPAAEARDERDGETWLGF
jgi:hypothetical protein